MKTIYLLLSSLLTAVVLSAQTVTNPMPQALPYSQNFDALSHTATTYPAGWQGWQLGTSGTTSISMAFRTSTPYQDKALVASGDASVTGGNIYNYNGKIGFLATGSLDPAIALSLKTTGYYNVAVAYEAMTIRNPGTRTNEFVLQYRVGSTGDFTTLTSTVYANNTTVQTNAVTTPQNIAPKSVNLPAACDNKDTVQLRWVSRDVNGSGGRPSFAVDSIVISGATTPPNTVSFAAGINAAEPSTNGSFTITLSTAAPAGGLSIGYTLSGTATQGSDYSDPQNGTIVVPAGATTATININVIDDNLQEITETIVATLTTSSIASPYVIANGSATINLLDDGDITPISYTGTTYTQDFNTLAATGNGDVLPQGWALSETGSSANTTYSAGDGSNNAGNTYSFGTGTATERSFDGLRSSSVVPTIGASFRNNTGATLATVVVTYTGKQWRVGTANRADRLDFQYSTNATRLNNGTWTNVDALDYSGPQSATVGAVDGNATALTITFTITGLTIPNGGSFFFRWTDFDASGADDGLAVDNFSLSPGCTPPTNQPTVLTFTPGLQNIGGSFTNSASGTVNPDRYLVIISSSATLTEQPSAGSTYALDDAIGGGKVVGTTDGTNGNAFTASELIPGTTYYFFVYAFTAASNCYNITSPLTALQATATPPPCTPPAMQVSAVTGNPITPNAITMNYTRGNGDNVLIIARRGEPVRSEPVNSLSYAMGSTTGSGDTVIYNGPAASFTYSSLQQNTAYYFALYEYAAAANCYLKPGATASFTTACSTPANVIALIANAGNGQATITWNNPIASCFDEVMVVVSGSSIDNNGSTYTGAANPAYTGAGAPQIVYRGSGGSVTVTGLANGTTYFVKVFTRLGSIYSSGIQVSALPYDPASGYVYLYGNFHAHSSYSDGNKDNTANTPTEDFIFARDALCMDYMGMSEHNHSGAGMQVANFHRGWYQANNLNGVSGPGGNSLVTLWGMEWGVISGGGHVLTYGFDSTLLGWEVNNYDIFVSKNDYASLFTTVNGKPGAVNMLAHPGSADFGNLASGYSAAADNAIVGCAVESGPAFSTATMYNDPPARLSYLNYFRTMLARGYHLAPDMDMDNHNLTFGRANANRTVVLAATRSREAIMEALRNSRFYASQDCNLRVDFKQGSNPMGSTVTSSGAPVLSLTAIDGNGEGITTIELWGGEAGNNAVPATAIKTYGGDPNGTVSGFTFNSSDAENIQPSGTTYYYYAIITEADGDKAVTAPIWCSRNDVILPVSLLSFNGMYTEQDKSVHLLWMASQEVNSKSFVVERSGDGQFFTAIGMVASEGNSRGVKQYQWTDGQPLTGTGYYRLRQMDNDNRFTLSRIVRIITDRKAVFALYPNPARSLTYLYSSSATPEKVTVQVIDNMGREVSRQIKVVSNGQPAAIEVAGLKSGNYFIQVTAANGSATTDRLLIQ